MRRKFRNWRRGDNRDDHDSKKVNDDNDDNDKTDEDMVLVLRITERIMQNMKTTRTLSHRSGVNLRDSCLFLRIL